MNEYTDSKAERSILITGCSSGIGYAAARDLKARGWRVFACCRKEADRARLLSEGYEALLLDYANESSIHAAYDQVLTATGGRLDALYNNGAFAAPGAVEDLPTDALRAIFEANVFGWHTLARRAAATMRAQGGGRIIGCSSVLGFVCLKYRGAYQATKYATEALMDTMRLEMEGSGIKVIKIQPGPIRTMIRQNAYAHFKRWIVWDGSAHVATYPKIDERLSAEEVKSTFELPPEAVVRKLIHALESDNPRIAYKVTFPTYFIAVLKRLLPSRLLDRILIGQSY
ncbi:MAG: SDR family NAD(P)-dependent oxidoreductase [Neomegalonema sp.]|nr:SDR family NAD(P)-dependent oxidoreductase [Neomegalonema sp.]